MGISSKYWTIWQISLASTGAGYKHSLVPAAQEFIQKQFAYSRNEDIQAALLSYFHAEESAVDPMTRALAGLCLRCYISEFILKACKKIDYLFGSEKHFNYQDLLPFVLNDDGETLIVLGSDSVSEAVASLLPRGDAKGERASALLQSADRKTQFVLNNNSETHTPTYKFFSLRILQTFKIDSQRRMSLDNWVYLQTKQNPELKDFLKEFGFKHLSDWALLNRARPKHLERLSARDRRLIEVFHAVYNRDRLQQHQKGTRRCQDPSKLQLQEMLHKLQDLDIIIHSTIELMNEIKQVATQFRHYDIWSSREPLEIKDQDTGNYTPRPDLPTDSLNEADIEEQEFVDLFHEQLELALDSAIKSEVRAIITKLEKSKNYSPFAPQFIPGLQLYYCDQLSLKEIAPKLGMTSWDQARRILNPGELLSKVRTSTVQQLLNSILKKASEKGLTKIPPEPEYLKTLQVQIEAFCEREIFTEAAEEIRAGKNRLINSAYSQQLCIYFREDQKRIMNEVSQIEKSATNTDQSDLLTLSLDVKQRELLEFLHEQIRIALALSIEQELRNHITALQKSKKYSLLTEKFIPGLQLYYCEGKPLREIAPKLGMTSWNQARRVLNPGELLNKVRTFTVEQLLNRVLKKAEEKGWTKLPPEHDYLKTLLEQIEAFADEEIFRKAAEEIRAGKNRSMNSVYAQLLCSYLQQA